MNNKINVRRLYLKHDGIIHEFKTYTSPFVCKVCYHDPNCPIVMDGFSDDPIEILNYNKFEKQFKYESTHFYGEGYAMDIISIEIKLINSYAFSILISRESPFTEMPLDFHEITSPSTLTPKYVHTVLLEKLKLTVKSVDSVNKLLSYKRDDDEPNHGFGTKPPMNIY
jgi:hypothetical protein